MGSSRSKLTSKYKILEEILCLLYDIDQHSITDASIGVEHGTMYIEATIDSRMRRFQQDDGSLVDMLHNIMNHETIIYNPYAELEESVEKYNNYIKIMGALNKQGL